MRITWLNRIPRIVGAGGAALSLFAATVAGAATYYVSPAGSDSNPGTASLPFRQIRAGVAAAAAGDTILVSDGIYLGFDVRGKQGAPGAPITIRAAGSNAEIVKTMDRSDNRDTIFITYSNHITIDGLRSFNGNRAAVRVDSSHSITVRNCVFGNNGTWGIFTNNSNDSLFEYNECYGSVAEHGIYVSNSSMRPTVRSNRLHDNAGCGLHMNGDLSMGPPGIIAGGLVENNIVWNNGAAGGAGINMDGPQDMVVRNNLLFNNSAGGITMYRTDAAEGPRNVQVLNNTVSMPSNGRWAVLIWQSTGSITLRNNILLHAGTRGGINCGNSTDVSNTDSDYNILDRATPNNGASFYSLAQWQSATGRDMHSLSASAASLFVNPASANYHLLSGAPAIDRGTTAAVPQDLEGAARPAGAGYDIGCYEAAGSVAPPPATAQLQSLTLSPQSVTGGQSTLGTVTLSAAAPAGGATVSLSSSNPWVTSLPSAVTVPAGQTSAAFTVGTYASGWAADVTITSAWGGISKSAVLFIGTGTAPSPTPPTDAALASFVIEPSAVLGGTPATGTLTLTAPAPAGGAVIAISNPNIWVFDIPATVNVPQGQSSVTFHIGTVYTGWPANVSIDANYKGVTKSAKLRVTK